jgi:hypothetical protein
MSEIDYSQRPLTYRDIEAYTQGLEIKDLARRRAVSTLPIIYSGKGDLTVVQQDFGIEAHEPTFTPYKDKRGRITPAESLDIGWRVYEETQSYHTEDLSTYNGAIEPLSLRSLLTSTNAEMPGERTIKGDIDLLSTNARPSQVQEDWYDVKDRGTPANAFFDSQDQMDGSPILGFAGGFGPQTVPFDDVSDPACIQVTGRFFREGSVFGRTRKSHGKGFTYDNSTVGTDSLAFGGLKR